MAAHLTRGIELAEFGPSLDRPLIELPSDRPVVEGDEIRGHIVRTDSFGNLITNIDSSLIPEAVRQQVAIEFGMQRIDGISRFYGEKDAGDCWLCSAVRAAWKSPFAAATPARCWRSGRGTPLWSGGDCLKRSVPSTSNMVARVPRHSVGTPLYPTISAA